MDTLWKDPQALEARVEDYKQALANGDFPRASWPHLAAWLGTTEEDLRQILVAGAGPDSPQFPAAQILRRTATWVRGQILSSEGWSGANATKGVFLLRQDVGDGVRYTDRPPAPAGGKTVQVVFGDGDPRGEEAFG